MCLLDELCSASISKLEIERLRLSSTTMCVYDSFFHLSQRKEAELHFLLFSSYRNDKAFSLEKRSIDSNDSPLK